MSKQILKKKTISKKTKIAKKKVSKKTKIVKKKVSKKTKIAKKKVSKKTKIVKKKVSKKKVSKTIKNKFKALVIVESPAKARTIKKYLGHDYTVKSSIGHIKDLPKNKIHVDIENNFTPHYEVIRGKRKVIKEIKDASKECNFVYLATDHDREGEAIAFHLYEEIGKSYANKTFRITFNEITQKAIKKAIENPMPLNQSIYEAQQTRRILDRLVGYQISPILWEKVRRGLSAGRVQSVAVRLITEREKEIRAFVPEEYWNIECFMEAETPPIFSTKLLHKNDKPFRPKNKKEAMQVVESLEKSRANKEFIIDNLKSRQRIRKPSPPLITSKLQQEAASKLHFTAKKTMMVAQQLYEGIEMGTEGSVGLITYMRTDSTRISDDALKAIRTYVKKKFGDSFLPEKPNVYKNKKSAQEAHEAIRPTSFEYTPQKVKSFLNKDQFKLYTLIWQVCVASQMAQAKYDSTLIDIRAGIYTLRTVGSVMTFRGYLEIYDLFKEIIPKAKEVDIELPLLKSKQYLTCKDIKYKQHFTKPKARFSESTLVKELEERGIGRPSTYAAIMSTIVTRTYVIKEEGRFHPTELGELITELLINSFSKILDINFTARMENILDDIESGKKNWIKVLENFYHENLKKELEHAKLEMRDVKREEVLTDLKCNLCEEYFLIKWGRNGSFLACKGYPDCRNTHDYKKLPDGTIELIPEETTDEKCPICKGDMLIKLGRYGRFMACKAFPECKGTRPMSIGVMCIEDCGGYVTQRRSQRGRIFYGCSNYPDCTYVSWDRPVNQVCPDCSNKHLISKYSKKHGIQIKCPNKECSYVRDPELEDEDSKIIREVF